MLTEKVSANVDIKSSLNSTDPQVDGLEGLVAGDHHDGEVERKTEAEIAALGKWYDQRVNRWIPAYSNAMFQVVMLSFVVFMTPGMYNALTGIGGSGIKKLVSDNASVALYSTFATVGFFGGTICNYVGSKGCLVFGGLGYFIYSSSLLCYNHTENAGFVIFAGAFLGLCAACLWAAQGAIIMSYPSESTKGRAIVVFWVIFNLGGVIGSIIPLVSNMNNKTSMANDRTFIAFIVLMACGSIIALFMLPMSKVWKADGTRVIIKKHPDWKKELLDLYKLLISDYKVWFFFPMFFASNWFYTYQFNDFNAGRFNLRTRSLNSLLYWFFQMVGSLFLGSILDLPQFRRSVRARIGWVVLFVFGLAIWGGGLKFQLGFNRADTDSDNPILDPIDFKQGAYIGPMFLYIFYGVFDAMFQTYCLWIMGSMSNDPKVTALYAGFYKGLQSAGAGIVWRLDALSKPYMTLFISSWALVNGTMLIALPIVWLKITDHTDPLEDRQTAVITNDEIRSVTSLREKNNQEYV